MHGSLFVRHAQHHIRTGTVFKAHQLAAYGFIAARFAPQGRRHHHGEQHFLAADAVHFLANDGLDFGGDAPGHRGKREDSVAHALHIAAAHHQRLAGDLAIRGGLLVALGDEVSQFHTDAPFSMELKNILRPVAGAKDVIFAVPPCFGASAPFCALYREHPAGFRRRAGRRVLLRIPEAGAAAPVAARLTAVGALSGDRFAEPSPSSQFHYSGCAFWAQAILCYAAKKLRGISIL